MVGGYAVALHGQPRFTKDIDVFVDPTPDNAVDHHQFLEVTMDSTTRALLIALGVLLVLALGLSTMMGGVMGPGMGTAGPPGPGMMPWQGWMGGHGMAVGGLVMFAFWGAVAVGIVLLIRATGGGGLPSRDAPLDVLKRRYAAGEISRDQYEQMRKDLEP